MIPFKRLSLKMASLLMVLSLIFAGCTTKNADNPATPNSTDNSASAATSANTQDTKYKIAFVSWSLQSDVPVAWNKGIENTFKDYPNVEYKVLDGKMSTDVQRKQIEDLITQKYNAIILQAADAAALVTSVQEAEKEGIPVITLNLDVATKHTALIKMASNSAGQIIAQKMAESMKDKGNVVIIQGPSGAAAGIEREKGFRDEMAKHKDIQIIAAQPADWQKDKAEAVMNNFLQAHPQIGGVYGVNDSMAEGAALAAKAANRLKDMVIWGDDGEKAALQMVEEGLLTGTIYTNCFDQGATAAQLALYLLSSHTKLDAIANTGEITMKPIVVTKDSVKDILPQDRW
jgi:ABC-type sugar transport system substrate-binding protein